MTLAGAAVIDLTGNVIEQRIVKEKSSLACTEKANRSVMHSLESRGNEASFASVYVKHLTYGQLHIPFGQRLHDKRLDSALYIPPDTAL
jgi:hypothetical protein